MSKQKYIFNHKTLNYERFEEPVRKRVGKAVLYALSTAVLALVLVFLYYTFFDSPKEKQQAREIELLKMQYEILGDKLDEMNLQLADLEQLDDSVYRVIFDADPIPSSIRKSRFSDTARYQQLQGCTNSDIVLRVSQKLDEVASQIETQSKSYDELLDLARNKAAMLACIPAILPLKEVDIDHISSTFGYRPDPIYKVPKFHSGIDFASSIGTEVYATGDGEVERVEETYWGYGNLVTLNHGYGYKTQYAHLSQFGVKLGEKVKRGQVIGYVGNTGKSTGPHLHYEVLRNGEATDPIYYFYNDLTPEEYEKILEQAKLPTATMD